MKPRFLSSRLAIYLAMVATAMCVALAGAANASAADSLYWSNFGPDKISFTALDATLAGDLTTTGATMNNPNGTAIDAAAGRIYWTNQGANKISFANLDGGGGGDLVTTGATVTSPQGLAIDPVGGRIYWANQGGANKISFANLDGTGGGDINTTGATVQFPSGVAIDPAAGRIYWSNATAGISFANLSNSGGGDLTTTGATVTFPAGVAIDPTAGRIYWANAGGTKISFASTSGGSGGDLTTTGATVNNPVGVAIDPGAGRIYWTNAAGNKVSTASLNGSGGFDMPTLTATVNDPTFPVLLKAPVAAGGPTVSGGSVTGSTLSCSQGSWAADQLSSFLYRVPRSFAYQWLRDGNDIAGATASTVLADSAGQYSCRVTAQNHAGSTPQTSAPVAVNNPPIDNSFQIGKVKSDSKKGAATIAIDVPGAGKLALAGKDVAAQSRNVEAGTTKLTVKAKGKAKKTLKKKGKVTLKTSITYTPTGGTSASQDKSVKLKLKKQG